MKIRRGERVRECSRKMCENRRGREKRVKQCINRRTDKRLKVWK